MSATILCVQEDRALADQYAEALEIRGYDPLPVHDGVQAMEVLKQQHADFVLLDVSLPREDGFEVLAQLRELPNAGPLPVLMLCGGDITADLENRAKALGAIGVAPSSINSEQLLSRVAEFVEPSLGSNACGRMLPDSGTLKEIPIPEILHELHQLSFAGALQVTHGRKRKAIEFRGGWPIRVRSNLISECLGHYLVEKGLCDESAVEESLARVKRGEGLQGEILVAMDVMDEEGVVTALEEHAVEKLFEIFSWCDGQFELRAGAEVQRGSGIALNGHPSGLICRGVRRRTPIKWIDRYIEAHAEEYLIPSLGAEGTYQAVDLDPKEAAWFSALDGTLQVGSLRTTSEAVRRLVFALISVELLATSQTPGTASEAARMRDARGVFRGKRLAGSDEESMRRRLAQTANRMQGQDHYQVLEIHEPTTDEAVDEAFERLSETCHPDLFMGAGSSIRQLASQVFDRIDEARTGLRTEARRAEYEKARHLGDRQAVVEEEGRRALRAETEFQKGERLMNERDYESALVCFGRAMENFPSAGEYRSHYGWCLYLCHPDSSVMLQEALEHCREGLKLAKDREKSYLLLGRLYKVMGKAGAAKKMFTRAVQIQPRSVEAMRELRIMDMRQDKDKGMLKRLFRR